MYKFIINGKKVYITGNPSLIDQALQEDYILQAYADKQTITSLLRIVNGNENKSNWVLFGKDVEKIKQEFCSFFKLIYAAGGVVINENEQLLLIHRRGFWDLPKGKVDEGETIEAAALREVNEETGLKLLTLIKPVEFEHQKSNITYHSYELHGVQCIKATYWYVMQLKGDDTLTPQIEEDIEQAIWVHKSNLHNYYDNMYENIKDVLHTLT